MIAGLCESSPVGVHMAVQEPNTTDFLFQSLWYHSVLSSDFDSKINTLTAEANKQPTNKKLKEEYKKERAKMYSRIAEQRNRGVDFTM